MDTQMMNRTARSSAMAGVIAAALYLVISAVMARGFTGEVFTGAVITGLVTAGIAFVISSVISLLKDRRSEH